MVEGDVVTGSDMGLPALQPSARIRRNRNSELFAYSSRQPRPDLLVPRKGRDLAVRPTPLRML
jgi:hypothetical protein